MRTAYQEQLSELSEQLGEMCGLAGAAMEHATQALLQADLALAEQVISDHEKIAELSAHAEESAFVLLALQAPAGPARRQDRPPTSPTACATRRGQRLLRRNGKSSSGIG